MTYCEFVGSAWAQITHLSMTLLTALRPLKIQKFCWALSVACMPPCMILLCSSRINTSTNWCPCWNNAGYYCKNARLHLSIRTSTRKIPSESINGDRSLNLADNWFFDFRIFNSQEKTLCWISLIVVVLARFNSLIEKDTVIFHIVLA